MKTPVEYARAACDTMMRKFAAPDLPPKGHFHYHQGVFLSGVLKTWRLTGEERYFQYARDWLDTVIDQNGRILQYDHADLDDIQPGILLYPVLDQTQNPRYEKAIQSVYAQVPDVPRCACGGFYHKVRHTGQMWLDGLYMIGPFLAEYGRRYNRPDLREDVIRHVLLMKEHTRDPKTGLWYHAWDETHQADWCDPDTGLAPEFWGRSLGWVPVAILDDLEQLSPSDPGYDQLQAIVPELLEAICRYQGPDGRWYQVVNKPDRPENWPENSCTCLFAAALARAVLLGLLPKSYAAKAHAAYKGVIRSLSWQGEDIQIGGVCVGTGVGTFEFYCGRPCSVNDLHGVGAFLLMCTALQQLEQAGL